MRFVVSGFLSLTRAQNEMESTQGPFVVFVDSNVV